MSFPNKQKVKEAIKGNLADIVSEQSIITSDGKKVVRVPIRTLEQYKFRYDPNDKRGVGQGDGETQVGDVLERYGKKQGQGNGPEAGDQPGVDFYEAEITIEDAVEARAGGAVDRVPLGHQIADHRQQQGIVLPRDRRLAHCRLAACGRDRSSCCPT